MILKNHSRADIRLPAYRSADGLHTTFYCQNGTSEHVVFNARIYGTAYKLAGEHLEHLRRWISKQPIMQLLDDEVQFFSICPIRSTSFGRITCRGYSYYTIGPIGEYDGDNVTTIVTPSQNDIIMYQMKIIFISAILAGVLVPILIIVAIIVVALLEALRVWIVGYKEKGM